MSIRIKLKKSEKPFEDHEKEVIARRAKRVSNKVGLLITKEQQ